MIKGIDVSHWQGDRGKIDWPKVKAAGYEFVFIKATQGTNYQDPRYQEQLAGARAAGIVCGHYHFANGEDAAKEAQNFLDTIAKLQDGETVILDWEVQHKNPVAWSESWLKTVTEKLGFKPLVYLNESTVKTLDWTPIVKAGYGLWEAKYGDNDQIPEPNEVPNPDEWPFFAIWQFSSKGTVPGITGNVDLNQANFDSVETLKKYGKPATTEPQPGKSPVEPVLRDALKFAHDIEIGDYIDPKDQILMAERLVELKKSELAARDKVGKIGAIINQ